MKTKHKHTEPGAAVMDAPAEKEYNTPTLETKERGGKVVKFAVALIGYIWVRLAKFIAAFAVADLKPNPANPRGPKPDTADMSGPITRPLLIAADGRIVQGHRRYAHAKAIGLATVPVLQLPKDTPEDAIVELAADHGGEKGLRRIELARSITHLTSQGHSEKKVFTLLREALNELNPIDPRDPAAEYKRHRGFIQQVGRLDDLRKAGHEVIADEYEKNWDGKGGSLVTARDLTAATAENGKEDKAEVLATLAEKIANPEPVAVETEDEKKNRTTRERVSRYLQAAWLALIGDDTDAGKVARVMLKTAAKSKKDEQKKTAAAMLAHVFTLAHPAMLEEAKKAAAAAKKNAKK